MKGPALRQYRDKRDFTQTREPSGDARVAVSTRLRFVIQKHAARRLHYDLRLEWDGVFKSWAVTRGPSLDPAQKRLAVEVEDHPLDYGDFEGTIPQGEYGGGTVQLWDRGYWQPVGPLPVEDAIAKGDLKFALAGDRLNGSFVLVRMRGDKFRSNKPQWLLIKHRDANAREGDDDGVLEEDCSVASGRSMAQIAAGTGAKPKPFMQVKAARAGGGVKTQATTSAKAGDTATAKAAAGAKVAVPRAAKSKPLLVKTIPRFVEPQLCRLADRSPDGVGWAHEVKLDGYRAQLHVRGKKVVIYTRNGLDWTDRFSFIATLAKALPDCLIDGEMLVLDEKGLPSFSRLQSELSAERSEKFHYFAFDLLFDGREDLRSLPLDERKARLKKLLNRRTLKDRIRYVAHVSGDAALVLESARTMGLEGIVSKRLDAPYQSGRGNSWIKIKCRAGQEVVLGGWTAENGELRSLLAGVHRKGKLVYVGRIGTGYGRRVSSMLLPKLEKLTRQRSPFNGPEALGGERNLHWLEPKLVAEIEFAGWSGAGIIRQAAFKGVREDKKPSEVVAEISGAAVAASDALDAKAGAGRAESVDDAAESAGNDGGAVKAVKVKRGRAAATRAAEVAPKAGSVPVLGVSVTKPDKALWPAFGKGRSAAAPVTKLDLAHYFESVGEWMLPHLAGRPCSLVRAPDGISGEQFFQRHAMPGMSPQFDLVKVRGDKAAYVQIDKIEALIAAARIGALELHSWNCTPNDPETAGRLVFDLDPAPDVAFAAVIAAALEVRERLTKVGLDSFCKTTGGKGLHVVTPLTGGRHAVEWPVAKNFAHLLCAQMAKDSPKKYLDTMAKDKRAGRIFLDYLRNDRLATAVTVLSPRARDGAPVSMPVPWNVVKKGLDPAVFTVRTAPSLLRKAKPWKDYVGAAGSLKDAIKRITR
jgi:bifunctional non-homologous end joining protein LigD